MQNLLRYLLQRNQKNAWWNVDSMSAGSTNVNNQICHYATDMKLTWRSVDHKNE